jgi:hypothetical protein
MSDLIKIQDFAALTLPESITVCSAVKTFEQLHSVEIPTITYMAKKHGDEKIQAYVRLKIDKALDFFNLKSTMNDSQITTTAEFIVQDFQWLTLSDISMCFDNAMKGYYGKLYAAIDGQVILLWFKQYSIDRSDAMEDLSLRQHYELKTKKGIHPDIIEAYQNVLREKQEVKNTFKPIDVSEVQKMAWVIFDRIDKTQKKKYAGTYPIIYLNSLEKHLTRDQFSAFYFKRASQKKH